MDGSAPPARRAAHPLGAATRGAGPSVSQFRIGEGVVASEPAPHLVVAG